MSIGPQIKMGWMSWLLIVTLSLLWGGAFFTTKISVESIPPLTVVWIRVAIAAIVLQVVLYLLKQRMPWSSKHWKMFLIMGILNNLIPFSLLNWGQIHIASGLAAILNATTPLFTVILAHLFTDDEKITLRKVIALGIGFLGVVVIIGPSTFMTLGTAHLLAQFAVLGAALSYACSGVYGRRFAADGVPPLAVATGQVTASSLLFLPVILFLEWPGNIPIPDSGTLAALVFLGVFSTAVAYVIFFKVLATSGATNLLLVTLLIPVSAIILGSLFLGETLSTLQWLGMGLIGIGLMIFHEWTKT